MSAAYAAAFLALFAALAALRQDLVLQAWDASSRQLALAGAARAKILAEAAFLAAILAFALRTISSRANPKKDALAALAATLLGWAVEAWGTRADLWSYYTGERPPLWILPAWTLGVLVVDRVANAARPRLPEGKGSDALLAALLGFLALFGAGFILSSGAGALHAAAPVLLAAGLWLRREPEDCGILCAGLLCVFFADLWGTTNFCWTYHSRRWGSAAGLWTGIPFGMSLDAAVVLLSLKAARPFLPRESAETRGGTQKNA